MGFPLATKRKIRFEVFNVRLLRDLDTQVRRGTLYRGDLSGVISAALIGVDLGKIELVRLHSNKTKLTANATQVVIPKPVRRLVERAAAQRGCSMNEMVNSALIAWAFKGQVSRRKTGRVGWGGFDMAIFDDMSGKEREQFFDGLAALAGLEPGPDGRMKDGTYYEYDPAQKATIEVAPNGRRYVVALRGDEFVRIRELGKGKVNYHGANGNVSSYLHP